MRVLVTRPLSFSKTLCRALAARGIQSEICPLLSIHPTPHLEALKAGAQSLKTAHLAIFISQNAVEFAWPFIRPYVSECPSIVWAAIGKGTAHALTQKGLPKITVPSNPPYHSEALLEMPELKDVYQKKILLFRGNGGRALLSQTLTERGGCVQIIESYQRVFPSDAVERISKLHHTLMDAIVISSGESLMNLDRLLTPSLAAWKAVPIIVVGLKMQALARSLAFHHPILADNADDASIIKALIHLRDKTT